MSAAQTVAVRASRRLAAAPERIFDAWVDPVAVGRFFFGHPSGRMVRAEVDPRVGGAYRFVDRRSGENVEHVGEYLALERPRRLAFTFAVPDLWPGVTRVTIEIGPHGGGSELALTQSGVHPDHAEGSEAAWEYVLDRLEAELR